MMPYITLINGEPRNVRQPTEKAAWEFLTGWIHSGPYAYKEVREVPADRWSDVEAAQLQRVAPMMFRHEHAAAIYPKSDRALVRESCQACCLEGYDSERERFSKMGADGPNVANWQRDYVQAGRVIPAAWRGAFYAYQRSDNERWRDALELDIATFGVRFSDE
jgi:hypothetical protein